MEQTPGSERLPTENDYKDLKGKLLRGDFSFTAVSEKLMEFDQLLPTRDAADENLKFLYDPEIVNYIHEHPEVNQEYKSILGFTEFHVAQRLGVSGSAEAGEHFKKSLENTDEGDEGWRAYVEGSVLYSEGKEIPEQLIEVAGKLGKRNADILRNFNAGLKERGHASYLEDYSKQN